MKTVFYRSFPDFNTDGHTGTVVYEIVDHDDGSTNKIEVQDSEHPALALAEALWKGSDKEIFGYNYHLLSAHLTERKLEIFASVRKIAA